jgi:hypothetical protein
MKPLGSPATIKLVATDPLPIVGVTINGTRQVNFFIDTGAPNIIVSLQLAQELGKSVTDAGQGTFGGGRRANVSGTVVPSLPLARLRCRMCLRESLRPAACCRGRHSDRWNHRHGFPQAFPLDHRLLPR